MESLSTEEAEMWVQILVEQKNRVQAPASSDPLSTVYFKLALLRSSPDCLSITINFSLKTNPTKRERPES